MLLLRYPGLFQLWTQSFDLLQAGSAIIAQKISYRKPSLVCFRLHRFTGSAVILPALERPPRRETPVKSRDINIIKNLWNYYKKLVESIRNRLKMFGLSIIF